MPETLPATDRQQMESWLAERHQATKSMLAAIRLIGSNCPRDCDLDTAFHNRNVEWLQKLRGNFEAAFVALMEAALGAGVTLDSIATWPAPPKHRFVAETAIGIIDRYVHATKGDTDSSAWARASHVHSITKDVARADFTEWQSELEAEFVETMERFEQLDQPEQRNETDSKDLQESGKLSPVEDVPSSPAGEDLEAYRDLQYLDIKVNGLNDVLIPIGEAFDNNPIRLQPAQIRLFVRLAEAKGQWIDCESKRISELRQTKIKDRLTVEGAKNSDGKMRYRLRQKSIRNRSATIPEAFRKMS